MEIERGLLEMYADPALDVKPKLLEERGGAFYSEASAMLIESLVLRPRRRAGRQHAQPRARSPASTDDAVVEVACRIDREGAQPLPVDPLAPRCSAWSSRPRPTSG